MGANVAHVIGVAESLTAKAPRADVDADYGSIAIEQWCSTAMRCGLVGTRKSQDERALCCFNDDGLDSAPVRTGTTKHEPHGVANDRRFPSETTGRNAYRRRDAEGSDIQIRTWLLLPDARCRENRLPPRDCVL